MQNSNKYMEIINDDELTSVNNLRNYMGFREHFKDFKNNIRYSIFRPLSEPCMLIIFTAWFHLNKLEQNFIIGISIKK